jgi:phage/plasmid primase-like uncharacterized protein
MDSGNISALFGAPFDASLVEPTRPDPQKYETPPEIAFHDVMVAQGLVIPGGVIEGKIVRVPMRDTRKLNGWYRYFGVDVSSGIAAGVFGDWRDGSTQYWSSKSEKDMSQDQFKAYQQRVIEMKAAAEAELKERHNAAAGEAESSIRLLPYAVAHPYLDRKKVKAYGLLQDGDALVVPVRNINGDIRSFQKIWANGDKRFMKNGETRGCFHLIGSAFTEPTYVAEGYATAATIHEVTGKSVVVAFNAGNLKPVVDAIRQAGNHCKLVVCADNDRKTEGNPGITAGQKACEGQFGVSMVAPEFAGSEGTDFNDMAAAEGLDKVRRQLLGEDVGTHGNHLSLTKISELGRIEPTRWLIRGYMPEDCFGVLYGPSSHGKSFGIIDMGMAIAAGKDWHGREVEQGAVVYVCGEGKRGIIKRGAAWARHYGMDLDSIPFYVSSRPVMMLEQAMLAEFKHQTIQLVEQVGRVSMVVIDTLNRNFGAGDENKTEDMTAFINACTDIQKTINASVIVVHHTGLQNTDRARGSSALRAALDVEMAMEKTGSPDAHGLEYTRLTCTKMKDDEPFKPIVFKMAPVGLETMAGQFGDEEVTSCVLVPEKDPQISQDMVSTLITSKSKSVQTGINIVAEMADTIRRNKPDASEILISTKEFKERFEGKAARRQAFYEVKEKLVEMGVLVPIEGNHHYWILGKI